MNVTDFALIRERIDALLREKARVLVAVEGGSASGKTTLARQLEDVYHCNVFHMDDFFLQPHQRTPARLAEPGGNVDRERFLQQVLLPLQGDAPFAYRVFDCSVMAFGDVVQVTPKALNIVEGAYSMHPALGAFYDLAVFLDIDREVQSARILRRNGDRMHRRFMDEWIPLEERYFAATNVKNRCHLRIKGE